MKLECLRGGIIITFDVTPLLIASGLRCHIMLLLFKLVSATTKRKRGRREKDGGEGRGGEGRGGEGRGGEGGRDIKSTRLRII